MKKIVATLIVAVLVGSVSSVFAQPIATDPKLYPVLGGRVSSVSAQPYPQGDKKAAGAASDKKESNGRTQLMEDLAFMAKIRELGKQTTLKYEVQWTSGYGAGNSQVTKYPKKGISFSGYVYQPAPEKNEGKDEVYILIDRVDWNGIKDSQPADLFLPVIEQHRFIIPGEQEYVQNGPSGLHTTNYNGMDARQYTVITLTFDNKK